MKCLIVYYLGGKWFGEDVVWKRSGSGTYREISRIEVPQSRAEIEQFARDNNYRIEWRGEIPAEMCSETTSLPASSSTPADATPSPRAAPCRRSESTATCDSRSRAGLRSQGRV